MTRHPLTHAETPKETARALADPDAVLSDPDDLDRLIDRLPETKGDSERHEGHMALLRFLGCGT